MKTRILIVTLITVTLLMSCSTMSFIPTEGGASKFNLATVEYVEQRAAAQEEELINNLADHIMPVLDSLLAEDREAMEAFTTELAMLDSVLEALTVHLDTTVANNEKTIAMFSKDLTTMKTNASSTRMVIRRINDNIDNLPVKALETFNEAIQAYLNKDQEPEAATE